MFVKTIKINNSKELNKTIKAERDLKIKFKLTVIFRASNGESVPVVSKEIGISKKIAYKWITLWNNYGVEGLRDNPHTGRPPQLTKDELSSLSKTLEKEEFVTTKDAKRIINSLFAVNFSMGWTRNILKEKLGLMFSKPYLLDERKPENAADILTERIKTLVKKIEEEGHTLNNVAIGFLDEASHQNKANTVRFWHQKGSNKVKKDMTKLNCSSIGFYAINGNSTSMIIHSSKKEELAKVLKEIANANESFEIIIVIADNFSSHHSQYFVDEAQRQGIYLLFLPPYSPDLNPVEFIWKDIKRVISSNRLTIETINKVIVSYFIYGFNSLSYAKSWIAKFIPAFSTFAPCGVPN